MELPADIIGLVFTATDDIRAAACVCRVWLAIGERHPDMVFWRARTEAAARRAVTMKLRRVVATMGLRRVIAEGRYHLIGMFLYTPASLMVCLDFNNLEQIKQVKNYVDEATGRNIAVHAALLKSPSCICVMCVMAPGPIMW